MHCSRFAVPGILVLGALALAGCDGPVQPEAAPPEAPETVERVGQQGSYLDHGPFTTWITAADTRAVTSAIQLVEGDGLTSFESRTDFNLAAPDVPLEDFEDAVPESGGVGCEGTFDSETDNACFSPGALLEGFSIRSFRDRMAVLRPGVADVTSTVVGPAGWPDTTEIAFTGEPVNAIGLDLLAPMGGPSQTVVEIFGSDGQLLGSAMAPVGSTTGLFWGVVSEHPIARIVMTPPDEVGLLLDDLAFGFTGSGDSGEGDSGDDSDDLESSTGEGVVIQILQRTVNPRSEGVIPVAVMSSEDFDATTIDPSTVRFGPEGAAPLDEGQTADLDEDGRPDLLFHFSTPETGLACGDDEATLTGATFEGDTFESVGAVRVLCPVLPELGLELRGRSARGGG